MKMEVSWHTLLLFASRSSYQPDNTTAQTVRSLYASAGLICRAFTCPLQCCVPLEAADMPEESVSSQAISHSSQKQGGEKSLLPGVPAQRQVLSAVFDLQEY